MKADSIFHRVREIAIPGSPTHDGPTGLPEPTRFGKLLIAPWLHFQLSRCCSCSPLPEECVYDVF